MQNRGVVIVQRLLYYWSLCSCNLELSTGHYKSIVLRGRSLRKVQLSLHTLFFVLFYRNFCNNNLNLTIGVTARVCIRW